MRGGKRKGAGRPTGTTKDNPRDKRVMIRLTSAEHKALESKALESGNTLTAYIRSLIL